MHNIHENYKEQKVDLVTKLQEDMKTALKGGQKDRLQVIRMVLSDVKNIDLMPNRPTAQQAVEAYGKKLRKSLDEYEKIGRKDEADKLRYEISVVDEYLPKKASQQETEKLVDTFLAANSFAEKDIGKAMGAFMKQHGANVDPALVNPLLKKKLQVTQ
jgi:uncharacterized protein